MAQLLRTCSGGHHEENLVQVSVLAATLLIALSGCGNLLGFGGADSGSGDDTGSNPGSGTGSITGMSPPDGAPTADATPTLSWDSVDGAASYEVQVADTQAGVSAATIVEEAGTSHTIAEAMSLESPRYWRVRAVSSDGHSGAWSAVYHTRLYDVGDRGPAGGIVFHVKDSYSEGWRWLEAAPSDIELSGDYLHVWGGFGTAVGSDSSVAPQLVGIGAGEANTKAIVEEYGASDPHHNTAHYAGRLADEYEYGGYSDWFLPSMHELLAMYENRTEIGGFEPTFYWSSSEDSRGGLESKYYARSVSFNSGTDYYGADKKFENRLRAIRAF